MKKLLLGLVVLLVLAAGFFAVSPYISVMAIQRGIADSDSATLVRYIDFPVLRQNVKDQLNAANRQENESSQTNFLSALMSGFKAKLVDSFVESLVTPEGLANLMSGKRSLSQAGETSTPTKPEEKQEGKEKKEKVFDDARFTYDSLDQFSVWLPTNKGEEMQLVLQRRGLVWKLVNIILPPKAT
ncbi:MAG: DUF2939 domain-containing protein [Cellvibrionaceae bacterium]|nr:DUF2939 domain-containing protein [Cellvibrionaceae bacterium]